MIAKEDLERMYLKEGASMMEIAKKLDCSPKSVQYWMTKYGIDRRSIGDAIYLMNNRNGDPFSIQPIDTVEKGELFGLGVGLYWGEGTKKNKHSVRLGNTDPELINTFIKFLVELFGVSKERLRFSLQIFTDIDPIEALNFWTERLQVSSSQFTKSVITISGSLGTYRQKSQYGVATLYFHNKKLRDIIVGLLPS